MREEKNTQRSTVHIGFDGRVHKVFRGPDAEKRFSTEVKVLRYLEERGCGFVPRLLDSDPEELKIITSNCGAIVQQLSDARVKALFDELETYGVRHDDPYLRNVTYRASDGRFCLIDFELATILDEGGEEAGSRPAADRGGGSASGALVAWDSCTDVGRFRRNNEDAYLALSLDAEGASFVGREGASPLKAADLIFAVSDGMGGARSGEFASRIAIDRITQLLPGHFRRGSAGESGDLDVLTHLFRVIHLEIELMGEAYPECAGMGATLSLCWITPGRVLFAHIGDSRIYRWRPGAGLEQLSEDHTQVAALLRAGQISEYEARNHPARNRLYKALGGRSQYVDPQLGVVDLEPGDRFLICSDGVSDGIWNRAIGDFLESGAGAAEVVAEAVKVYGRDNATAVVVAVD